MNYSKISFRPLCIASHVHAKFKLCDRKSLKNLAKWSVFSFPHPMTSLSFGIGIQQSFKLQIFCIGSKGLIRDTHGGVMVKMGKFICSTQVCKVLGSIWLTLAFASLAMGESYIVKSKDRVAFSKLKHSKIADGAKFIDSYERGLLSEVKFADVKNLSRAQQLLLLRQSPGVEYVVANFKLETFATPNDPSFSEQWALEKIGAVDAWDTQTGSHEVVVAVIDTGVDTGHADLAANIWTNPTEVAGNGIDDDQNGYVDDVHGYDFLENDGTPNDETSAQNPGHGTHCSGIIGAVGNNGQGISGISQSVSLMALRFIGPTGQGDLMGAIKAIDYAIDNKADIISASWGASVAAAQAQPLIEAIGRASDAGLIFVAAAANNGASNDTTPMYPANADFPNLISVAASDNADNKPQWSNYGKARVDLAAPGVDILSTIPGNYSNLSGTSMATPLVAGLVALLKSQTMAANQNQLSGLEMQSLLQSTGTQVAIETACNCRIDAGQAINALNENTLIVVPNAATMAPGTSLKAAAIGGMGGNTFTSADPAIVEMGEDGTMTAIALGETSITVRDQEGNEAQSLAIRVAELSEGTTQCPLGDEMLCMLMCLLDPTLPWCQ
jgi:thermitase